MTYTIFKCYVCLIFSLLSVFLANAQYQEKYRPQYHFSPLKGWIGDPDGLVFTEGKYHLFWWGHAVSTDLVQWTELPYPMKGGDGKFSYFSGSVVVDKKNTAGFGEGSMIAVYTKHLSGDSLPETQAISASNDGISFKYYENNPVLDIKKIFFRDPQVFWYEPEQKWVMVVALPAEHKIQIYESKDIKNWVFCSEFGGLGAQNAFWECPDLFQVPIKGNPSLKKWVMMIGRGPNRVQYFPGHFDGKTFIADRETIDNLTIGKGLPGKTFTGFDGKKFDGWKMQGNAFGDKPVYTDTVVHLGRSFASSASNLLLKGALRSPDFTINQNAINFLIAGGNYPGQTCINLIIDDKVVRTTTGDGSNVFKWNGWDVSDLKNKVASIQIVDLSSSDKHGYFAVDHIQFADQILDNGLEHALWLDYGQDYYATRTWRDIDQKSERTVAIGWMGNWEYARKAPTSWGKGFQSLPRIMELKETEGRYRLTQNPVPELNQLRKIYFEKNHLSLSSDKVSLFNLNKNSYEMELIYQPGDAKLFGVDLLVGEGRKLRLSYNYKTSELCLDRTLCTDFTVDTAFTSKFAVKMKAPVKLDGGLLKLKIFVDQASVEIFTNEGEVVLSAVTYPSEKQLGVDFFSQNGQTLLQSVKVWEMASVWRK